MKQIFISYRRIGGVAAAFLLHERLTALGYEVFYDIESLQSGRFDNKIFHSIDECSDVLVVLSPSSLDRCVNEDDWMRAEVSYAIKQGKNIIPVMMDGFEFPATLPEEMDALRNYNGVPLQFKFFDGVMDRIVTHLTTKEHGTKSHAEGQKKILVWADFDNAILDKIIKRLALDDTYFVEELDDPLNILARDLDEIYSIVLIVTDCTKFSNNPSALTRINQALVDYVRYGGKLICTHDAIYRRTRNDLLQEMYGCKITHFREADGIDYVKTDDCKELGAFPSLPDGFVLHDAELCWGDLAYDVNVYFETPDGMPLVFSREYGNGVCIYLHSGDYKFNPPPSLGKPEREFVTLLRDAIQLDFDF